MYFTFLPGIMIDGEQMLEPWRAFISFQCYEPGDALEPYDPAEGKRPLNILGKHKKIDCMYDFNKCVVFKILPPKELIGKGSVFHEPIGITNNTVVFEKMLCHPVIGQFLQKIVEEAEQEWNVLYKDKVNSDEVTVINLSDFFSTHE